MCALEHFQNSGYLLSSIWLIMFCSKLTAALYPLYMIWAIRPYNEHEEHPIPEFLAQFSLCQNTGISVSPACEIIREQQSTKLCGTDSEPKSISKKK